MEKKKKKPTGWIIALCVVSFLIYYGVPLIFLGIISFFDNEELNFTYNNGTVQIEDEAVIKNLNAYYDENEKSYIIEGYLYNNDLESISIEFNLYDENNIMIGHAYSDITLEENKVYKVKAYYNEYDANTIMKYNINHISEYGTF